MKKQTAAEEREERTVSLEDWFDEISRHIIVGGSDTVARRFHLTSEQEELRSKVQAYAAARGYLAFPHHALMGITPEEHLAIRRSVAAQLGDEKILAAKRWQHQSLKEGTFLVDPEVHQIFHLMVVIENCAQCFKLHSYYHDFYRRLLIDSIRLTKYTLPLGGIDTDQYYTPKKYIDAARRVMGSIDIDPASNALANETVKASVYYDANTNGLKHPWRGRVWMNPPYSKGLGAQFINKLIKEYKVKRCKEAVVLWIAPKGGSAADRVIKKTAKAMCHVDRNIEFVRLDGETERIPYVSVFYYLGPNVGTFHQEFKQWGTVARL